MSTQNRNGQKKPNSLFKQAVIIICIAIGILLALEVISRLLLPDFQEVKPGQFRKDFQIDPLITSGVFLLDENTFWRVAPNKEAGVNENGFRDAQNTVIKKPEDVYRIICIGDSVTFGVPVELNPPEKTFAKRLEALFEKHPEYGKVEVLNAGNPGYTSYQGLQQLKTRLLKFEPDLVIVQFGINDPSPAVVLSDKEQPTFDKNHYSLYNALGKSALCCAIVKIFRTYGKDNRSSNTELVRVPPDDFKKNLLMILALGELNGFDCLILRPVCIENGRLETLTVYPFPRKAKVVDLLPSFANYAGDRAELFYDPCHLTPKGHELMAKAIFNAIAGYGILDKEGAKKSQASREQAIFQLKTESTK